MSQMALIGLAIPGMAGCLSAIFAGFWYYNRQDRAALLFAIAYACSAVGFGVSNYLLAKESLANAILNNAIYGAGILCLFLGTAVAFNRKAPTRTLAAIAVLGVIVAAAISLSGLGLNYRVVTLNMIHGVMTAFGAFHLRAIWKEHWSGSAAIVAFSLITLNFLLIAPLTAIDTELTASTFFNSAYWLSMNVITGLSVIASAGALISICVCKNMQRIHDDANQDFLTGLQTRRAFETTAQFFCSRRSGKTAASLILLDIDHFKAINDTYGHTVGDTVISAFGDTIRTGTRRADISGRVGGEEFCLILPGTDIQGARCLAARLKQRFRELDLPDIPDHHAVTASFGIAEFGAGSAFQEIYAEADAMLYAAKQRGRDRIVCAEPPIDAGQPLRREVFSVVPSSRTA